MHTKQPLLQPYLAFMLSPRIWTVSFLKYRPLTVLVTQPLTILNVRNLLYYTGNPPPVMLTKTMNMQSTAHLRPVNVTTTEEQACQHVW